MRGNRGVGEIGPAAADRTRVLEQRLEAGREDRIAVVDGILRIADQMREAELMLLGMLALRRQPVRQPQLRLYAGKKRRRHALAAGGGDDEGGGCRTAERPLPPGLALHARARLVAGDRLAGAHLLRDPLGRLSDCLADAGEHVGDDTLRDGEAEQSLADLGQPLVADHLAAVQVRDDRRDAQRATWPNGVPSGMSAGALAVTRALQHEHVARSSSMPVVIGLIGGMSI
jgi:hypothetical protein